MQRRHRCQFMPRLLVAAMVLAGMLLSTLRSLPPRNSYQGFGTNLVAAPGSCLLERNLCYPRRNIMFLKTHKCASSTTQRIFLRYSKKHGLSLVLPAKGNYLGFPIPFQPNMIPASLRSPDDKYNMMIIHTRLNIDALAKVMKADAAWVTIVREPLDQLQSLWFYYNLKKVFKMPLEKFADLPYEKAVRLRASKRYGIHQMFFDMGYGSVEDYQPGEMTKLLERLDEVFDLVMITERYDESLVLLKNLMCWTTEDISYISVNRGKNDLKPNIPEKTREKLLRLDQPDVLLYNFFYKRFEQKLEEFGREQMQHELKDLREANERLRKECLVEETSPDKATKDMDWPKFTVKTVAVRKGNQLCNDLAKTELSFVQEMRDRQKAWVKGGWRQSLSELTIYCKIHKETRNGTKDNS